MSCSEVISALTFSQSASINLNVSVSTFKSEMFLTRWRLVDFIWIHSRTVLLSGPKSSALLKNHIFNV